MDFRAPAVATLVTLLVVLGAMIAWSGHWQANQWMAATRTLVLEKHNWWRAWTALVVHADPKHLLSNSFLFFILGTFLFGYFGTWAFPVLPFVFGGLTNFFVLSRMSPDVQLMGVSGVVFWMGGFWLVLYLMIDRRRTWAQRSLRAGGVALGIFMPTEAFDPGISYLSHLIGFVSGVTVGFVYYAINRQRFRAAEVIETVMEEDEPLEVNAVQEPQ